MKNGLIVYSNGTKFWYQNDRLHRTDGPAIEYPNGSIEYWLNDDQYSYDEFTLIAFTNKVKL